MNIRLAILDLHHYTDTLLALVFCMGLKIFARTRLWGPPSLLFNGYWGLVSRMVQRQRREADHSPLSSAEFKKMELYLHSPICLYGIVVK
jgi:hypothetical protein